ncbi:LLM class flavin-dependent oxidoreductase [Nonomuraea sp. NEAU-A123]|uniref:LLM class flavin-dependent oxidoreductase n=1 Tax=Nonomuraea sp. NEAU-A123 TaxID=2839649 RepID=UPI001BE3F115|nr:LLM class flavin-dependent oxidoreductase [Nonomuraea sp. NEAU-A123]MBT2229726.1 LLM class flavin-dependent oxidoreductase [Nonomuraea sp. NEAU-A123]
MNVGLGLPINDPAKLLTWARRADAGPFSSLGLLDRLVYDNPEPLVTLAVLAGATSRVRVQTEVLIAPLHNTAVLAKQAATLDRLSGGRFTLGIGTAGREDDYLAAGADVHRRGRRLDEQLALLRRAWSGEPYGDGAGPIGPAPARPGGPEVLFGGFVPAVFDRVARWGDGFLGAGLGPEWMDTAFRDVEQRWALAGREGRPRLVAQVNVALGPEAVLAEARKEMGGYYAFTGRAEHMLNGLLTTPTRIRDAVTAFTGIGADEVMLYCWASDPDQIHRLADTLP